MKEGLNILYALQQKDNLLKEIECTIREIPLRIKDVEMERDSKSEIIEKAKKTLQGNVDERKKMEQQILAVRDKIQKYKEQMKKVTTNKEYQGFITEIKFEESNINQIEEHIIEKMVESDAIMEKIRQAEEEYRKITEEYNSKITTLKENLAYNLQKQKEESKNREKLLTQSEKDLLRVYNNLFVKKGGRVVSFVETEFCGICNIKLRPQVLSEIYTSKDILVCENCGRILFKDITLEIEAT